MLKTQTCRDDDGFDKMMRGLTLAWNISNGFWHRRWKSPLWSNIFGILIWLLTRNIKKKKIRTRTFGIPLNKTGEQYHTLATRSEHRKKTSINNWTIEGSFVAYILNSLLLWTLSLTNSLISETKCSADKEVPLCLWSLRSIQMKYTKSKDR